MQHQLYGGGADVADPALGAAAQLVVVRIVPDPHQVAVARLDVDPVGEPGGQPQTRQRGQVVIAAVDGVDVVEIAATFGEHREDVAKGQSAYHRQGGPLTVEVVAGDVPVTG